MLGILFSTFCLTSPKDFEITLLSNPLALSISEEGYSRNVVRIKLFIYDFVYFL